MLRVNRSRARPCSPVVLLVAVVSLGGCYRVRSQLIATTSPPDEIFHCVQLELGRSGYAIVGADRASGWLHGQKRVQRLFDVVRAEIYATVIPPGTEVRSHLQLTDNTHAEEDADRIRASCAPSR